MITPVWFLDVDGVINHFGAWPPDHFMIGKACAELHVDDDKCEHRKYQICWDPTIIEAINKFHTSGKISVRWLTTWGSAANQELRELIEIERLPVAHHPDVRELESHWNWWKLRVVKQFREDNPDTPIIWTDDDLNMEPKALQWAEADGNVLVISPSPYETLTEVHINRINLFLKKLSEDKKPPTIPENLAL